MSKSDLIKELRALTQAGMKDCADALAEADGDLQKAVDLIKIKGLNIVSGRESKVASEGMVAIASKQNHTAVMVEINCQTDFVSRGTEFREFAAETAQSMLQNAVEHKYFSVDDVSEKRAALSNLTKENIVIRRWWVEEAMNPNARVFSYVHINDKVGALVTLLAPSEDAWADPLFLQLGEDLLMQVTAMNPVAISMDMLPTNLVERQRLIFENQLKEANKPQTQWEKIINGKFNKWYSETCLLNQESIVMPKVTVAQTIKNVADKLGGEITVVSFTRCQVGEGLDTRKVDEFALEVAKLAGVPAIPCPDHEKGICLKNHTK